MSVVNSVRKMLVPVHPEGYVFIAAAILLAIVGGWIWSPLGWLFWIAAGFVAYFFRDPPRVTPTRDGLVVAPADGRVDMVGYFKPPPELGLGDRPLPRITIFLSVFDVHIQRAPIGGRVTKIAYTPGLFVSADLDKASEDNERNGIVIDNAHGRFGVVQIAGLIARRIVCFVREGEELAPGERYGLIRFGSRVDIFLPETVKPLVGVGQKAIGGETILADLKAQESQRTFRVA